MQRLIFIFCAAVYTLSLPAQQPRHKEYLKVMEKRMTIEEKDLLKQIYEPVVVAVPLEDSRNAMCIMPDGEIRAYGKIQYTEENPGGVKAYLSSTDCGLTWKLHYAKGKMGSATYIPFMKKFVKVDSMKIGDNRGTYFFMSKKGPDDPNPKATKISDYLYCEAFLPQKSEYSDRIFFTSQRHDDADERILIPTYIYSDDKGKTFHIVEVSIPPIQKVVAPDKSTRWIDCGVEPVVCELSKGEMMMLLRNSTNHFYGCFSHDGGESWSDIEPSLFQGTATTPFLLALSDGRILNFWDNTRPLPENDHSALELDDDAVNGHWEDVFTNRDASHAAISSDDGKTWTGAREIFLNTIRNRSDFRYFGSMLSSHDKSVHQFQAYELPFNKILVSVGQNEAARKLFIFDVDWLSETSRSEDFMSGLEQVSTQVYLKSLSGCTLAAAGNGHCQWNRTNGVIMSPDPAGSLRDVAHISYIEDDRLYSSRQGIVWNFPTSRQGVVEAEIYLSEDAVRISLADCWYNPCDESLSLQAPVSVVLDKKTLSLGQYHKIKIEYDTDLRMAQLFVDEEKKTNLQLAKCNPMGLSYIIIQCESTGKSDGVYVKSLLKK